MTFTYSVTPQAYLLLAIEALKFAGEQPAISAQTRQKTAIALASARRDLAKLKRMSKRKASRKS